MPIELTSVFQPHTDELFSTESKKSLLTNTDFDWTGAHSVKIYRISTVDMNDYARAGAVPAGQWSRYGPVATLNATTQSMTLTQDRSFTFEIDKLDTDETAQQLAAASALARQLREVTVPEVDAYVFSVMCANAGFKPAPVTLTAANIYDQIVMATEAMDLSEVPESGRILVITPTVYRLLKQSPDVVMETDVGNDLRLKGVIATIDGMTVMRIPATRLPNDFGFLIAHPVATVAPTKLEDYSVHQNPPGISGNLVEGRIVYDAFVLDNKRDGLYYQAVE